MPSIGYWFTGTAITTFLAVVGSGVALVGSGVGWYRAAVTEEKAVTEKQEVAGQAEKQRRLGVLDRLRQEWIVEKGDGIPPRIAAGLDLPPNEWLNRKLKLMGESWRVP